MYYLGIRLDDRRKITENLSQLTNLESEIWKWDFLNTKQEC
jgi:hypothetical protein